MIAILRRLAFLACILSPVPGLGQVCIAPGEPFECFGDDCEVTAGPASGQQHDVVLDERRIRVRAVDSDGTTEFSSASLFGVEITPQVDMFVYVSADVSYTGFLTGFGGGAQNFGSIEVFAAIRDLGNGDLVASDLVVEHVNQGAPAMGGPDAFGNLPFGPPVRGDVPNNETLVLLEGGRTYGIGIGAVARARGGLINPGESDYFTGGNGVILNALQVVTRPDLSVSGFEDGDGDGLPDVWETDGVTDCDGTVLLDLPGFGADPDEKDLFVELDWQAGRDPGHPASPRSRRPSCSLPTTRAAPTPAAAYGSGSTPAA